MRIVIPPALRSYTGERGEVEGHGASLAAVLADLDARYPGIRFRIIDEQDRIRTHMRIFVNQTQAKGLELALTPTDKLVIVCALSGG